MTQSQGTFQNPGLPQNPVETITADVIVIGAGVAGGLTAWQLALAGHSVAVLDAGPVINRWSAVDRFRKNPEKDANSPYISPSWAPAPDGPCDYYVQDRCMIKKDDHDLNLFGGISIRGIGGTSWHWTGHAERFGVNDFRTKTAYGVGVDWPISYADLEPWYYKAEQAWGVSGSMDNGIAPPRSKSYPLPPIPLTWLDRQVALAAAHVSPDDYGPVEVAAYPHARNSIAFDDRPQCCGNASCRIICPIGAKYDASVHVMKAEQAGAKIYPEKVAYFLSVDENNAIDAVAFMNPDGSQGIARGKLFVVACHAVETPRLLLLSTSERSPNGVANSSDMVGRNLTGAVDVDSYGYSPQPVYPYRGPVTATGGFLGLRDGAFRKDFASVATFIVNGGINMSEGPFIEAHRAIREKGLLGADLANAVYNRTAHEVYLSSTVEVMPSVDNRVQLDASALDPLGLPRPHLTYHVDDYTRRGIEVAQKRDIAVLKAMQASEITAVDPVGSAAIIAGTARMGDDPRSSVTDTYGRSHDHRNLFILGNCNFVTTTVASPSLTTAAITLRAAEHIKATWTDGSLG
jgi:choline dehydrogenase-like flavoprotein